VLALVARNAAGLSITETPGLAVPALSEVSFAATPASILAVSAAEVADLSRLARLGLLARALGAATRNFEMVVDYAKERQQFGQPIGKFQAIQHKLANCLMSLEGARLTLNAAATAFDLGQPDWRYYASAAYANASPTLRQVSLETLHTFGAIGYAEEHEAPRHFRRTHADLVRHGGVRRARNEVAQTLLDDGRNLPEYDLGTAGNAFRAEVREWLKQEWVAKRLPVERSKPFHERGLDKSFYGAMSEKGWTAASWPKEYGGQARTPLEQLAMIEEFMAVQAPGPTRGNIQAFALMGFGTPEQQAEFMPKLYKGETWFCLGYSEPAAGSDLVSLKTTAVKDGDEWVINGQKIWTTFAEHSDYIWLAARTDPQAKSKHAGISIFMVPMNTPGITVHPSMALYGHTFCNEFFDNVRVPASALVGQVNGGWKILMAALATERVSMGGFVAQARQVFELLLEYVRQASLNGQPMKNDPIVRDRIGHLASEIEVARQMVTQSVMIMEKGRVPAHEAAMSKAYTAELIQRVTETAIDLTGMGAILAEGSAGAITNGRIDQVLRQSIMLVVGGGTNEIQRNIIAQMGLGLPR
jgi:alkylation response protein AidB-like acyl-CoA dehydrogenase